MDVRFNESNSIDIMYKLYIKQALQMLRENTLVSVISIAGTALSIAMVLLLVLVFQINSAGYAPVSNRDRMLLVNGTTALAKDKGDSNRGGMSSEVVRACFYTLTKPEAVTAYCADSRPLSLPGKRQFKEYKLLYTDPGYWKVTDYRFTEGASFSEADFDAALPRMVISDKVARAFFGSAQAVGKDLVLDFVPYKVCGVVKEVSQMETMTYADVWLPYTCNSGLMAVNNNYAENISGNFRVTLLAHSPSDFEAIRAELAQQTERYNEGKVDYNVDFMHNPVTQLDLAMGSDGFRKVDWREYVASAGAILFLLLLIPALNLVGVIQSSVQKRQEEIALRKVFGATGKNLLVQVLTENLVTTAIGGVIGIGLSLLLLLLCRSFLFEASLILSADKLFRPGLFLAALLFTFLLNLLSAGLPAWRTTRQPVVEALKGSE